MNAYAGDEARRCRHCHVEIRLFDHGNGMEWLHIKTNTAAGRPGPYKHCETSTVATPPETVGEWAARVFGPLRRDNPTEAPDTAGNDNLGDVR